MSLPIRTTSFLSGTILKINNSLLKIFFFKHYMFKYFMISFKNLAKLLELWKGIITETEQFVKIFHSNYFSFEIHKQYMKIKIHMFTFFYYIVFENTQWIYEYFCSLCIIYKNHFLFKKNIIFKNWFLVRIHYLGYKSYSLQ